MSKHTRAALASVVSGISLCESFSDVHACIEALAGEPIMTHQMPRWHKLDWIPAHVEVIVIGVGDP